MAAGRIHYDIAVRLAQSPWLTPILGGLLGAVLFLVTLGPAIVRPTNLGWLMRHDTQTYLLAWHHFRREPWQWPPGKVVGVGHPVGTSVGNSDAIPLVALPLKPFHALLPDPAQYLGAWLLVCFVLQGVFGALLVRQITASPVLQVLGAALFVQTPALLQRSGHVALCAHWMLLAAIWLCVAHPRRSRAWRVAAWTALGAAVGATQPYLAVMVLALALADLASDAIAGWRAGRSWHQSVVGATLVVAAMVGAMWLTGIFLVGSANFQQMGFGEYSMNLLSPVISLGYSSLLPAIDNAFVGQNEGVVYFGVGWLASSGLALVLALTGKGAAPPLRFTWLVVAGFLLYAIGPVITVGPSILADLRDQTPALLSVFRSSGRFAWLAMYVAFVAVLTTVVKALPPRTTVGVLAVTVALQAWDLNQMYLGMQRQSHNPAWIEWDDPLKSEVWNIALPYYRHVVTVPPDMCASVETDIGGPHLPFSLRAGSFGATMNSGFAGRYDLERVIAYCRALQADMQAGRFADDSLYVLSPAIRAVAGRTTRTPLACGTVDGFQLCVTEASAASWRDAALARGFSMSSVPARR